MAYQTHIQHHRLYPWTSLMAAPYKCDNTGTDDCASTIEDIKTNQANIGTIYVPHGTFLIETNLTIPATMALEFEAGGKLAVATGVTLTINGPLSGGLGQRFSLSGTGTVAGFDDVPALYPEWWGATSDAFEQVLSAAMTSGKPIVLTQASYDLSTDYDVVTLTGNLRMRAADGVRPTITGDGIANFVTMAGYSIDIEGIIFDDWETVFDFTGLAATIPELRVHRCNFTNIDTGAIYSFNDQTAGGQLTKAWITDNIFDTVYIAIVLQMRTIHDVKITGNHFEDVSRYAVVLGDNEETYQNQWSRFIVKGNTFKNIIGSTSERLAPILVYGYSANIEGNQIDTVQNDVAGFDAIYAKCRYATIANNTVIDGGDSAITIKGYQKGDSGGVLGHSVTCVGNNLMSTTTHEASYDITAITIGVDSVVVANNNIEGFDGTVIEVQGGLEAYESVKIINNNISASRSTYSMNIKGLGPGFEISGNNIEGGTRGINIASYIPVSTVGVFKITDNYIYDTTAAIYLDAHADTEGYLSYYINNNIIDTAADGIVIATSKPLYLEVVGNAFTGLTDDCWEFGSTAATDYFIQGNRGLTVQTTDATATVVVPEIKLDTSKVALIKASCVGAEAVGGGADMAGYEEISLWYDNAGTATKQGATAAVFAVESDANWAFSVSGTGATVRARVTGVAATTVNWQITEFSLVTR